MGLQKRYGKRELEKLFASCPLVVGDSVEVIDHEHSFVVSQRGLVVDVFPSHIRRGEMQARVDFGTLLFMTMPVAQLRKLPKSS